MTLDLVKEILDLGLEKVKGHFLIIKEYLG
jgi:hypothetical protein